jgi:hypothetical protein
MDRADVLKVAETLIMGDRHEDYGDPKESFENIAIGWSVIFKTKVEPYQVALCMDWLKTCRLVASPQKLDSWVDKVGYSALGAEITS